MSSKIRDELVAAAGIAPKSGEDEAAFLIRLQKAISEEITEDQWNGLSPEAQDWNNDAADMISSGKPIKPFADEVADAAPAPAARRRGAAASVPGPYVPKVGDAVTVTTARGKVVDGIITAMDEKSDLLYTNPLGDKGDEKDDDEFVLSKVKIAPQGPATAAAPAEPAGPVEPEVSDTVEVVTARDKTIVGNITEITDDELVLKDSTGEIHELSRAKLKSVKVKVKNAGVASAGAPSPAPAPVAGGRRRGDAAPAAGAAAAAPAADGEKPKRSSNAAGVSVGQRINEIVIDNPTMKVEDVGAMLKKEGLEFRDNTLGMTYSSAHKFLGLLRTRKIIK